MEKTKNIQILLSGEVEGSEKKKRGGGRGKVEQIAFFFNVLHFPLLMYGHLQ